MMLDALNALDEESAERELLRCCGSSRWAGAMAAARPFPNAVAMAAAADAIWSSLNPGDWLEAFAAHPKIGAGKAGRAGGAGREDTEPWSQREQAGVAGAAAETMNRLADANREYEVKFGYIFIVCATGKTADEMLSLLEARLRHDAGEELPIAAEEQRKITRLRLRKLLEQGPDTIS
jgi:allantoicase